MNWIELVAWFGAVLLLVAYGASAANYVDSKSNKYHFMNFAGAGLLLVNAIYNTMYPFVMINGFWAAISLVQLLKQK